MTKSIADVVYPERRFGGFSRVDGTIAFYTRIAGLLNETTRVLDIGCGRGQVSEDPCRIRRQLCDPRGEQRHVLGIDVDDAARVNPIIDEYRPIENVDVWPVDSNSIDVAIANSVVEHVAHPERFFGEAFRVLKPGGYLAVRTYNTWSYVGIASRLVPNSLHAAVTSKVQKTRKHEDVFPTLYRCNTRRKLTSAMRRAGLDAYVYAIETEPNYLQFSRILYRLGAIAHSVMPPAFRWTLLAFGQKPEK